MQITDLDMTSYSDDIMLLASAPTIVEADARANRLCTTLVRWADGKQVVIAPQKSSLTLFTSDASSPGSTHKCESETRWPRWKEPLKSWVLRWTPTSPSAVMPVTVSSDPRSRTLNVMKTVAGSSLDFTTETNLVHSRVFFPPGQTWGDPERGSEDRDLMPSKGCGVHLKAAVGSPPTGKASLIQANDWGDYLVSGAQHGALDCPPISGPSRTIAASILYMCPLLSPRRILLTAPDLPPLRRLGQRSHMPRPPCRRRNGGQPLQLSHTSHRSGPEDMWTALL